MPHPPASVRKQFHFPLLFAYSISKILKYPGISRMFLFLICPPCILVQRLKTARQKIPVSPFFRDVFLLSLSRARGSRGVLRGREKELLDLGDEENLINVGNWGRVKGFFLAPLPSGGPPWSINQNLLLPPPPLAFWLPCEGGS